jgi:mRNA interferase RelE/StbE
MKIEITRRARKDLLNLDHKMCARILDAIEGLRHDPPAGDVKKLRGMNPAVHRLRVGDFRVMFRNDIEKETIFILHVARRRDMYR